MLWITVSSGEPGKVIHPNGLTSFIHGLRAVAPFFAVVIAAGFTYYSVSQHRHLKISWLNPLSLSVGYGVVGLIALVESVDASVAFYWNALYLSVPLVLLAISADEDGLEHLARILNSTWAIMVVASLSLFMIGVVYLNVWDSLVEPSLFLECNSGSWHDWTDGKLRDTGVGRYAAIAGLLALSGLWQPRLRGIWAVVLIISATLLLFTGARGSFVGFCFGAIPAVLLHSGRKGIVVGTAVAVVLLPVFLITGAHETFLNNCIFRTSVGAPASTAPVAITPAPETTKAKPISGEPSTPVAISGEPSTPVAITPAPETTKAKPISEFLEFTGRTKVWGMGMELFRSSPIIGKGFHADRLVLNTHMHNGFVHAMVQTGILGTIAYLGSALFGWVLLFKIIWNMKRLPIAHKRLVIQSGAVLAYLTVRAIPESTAAFFGIDWLILAPLLIYLYLVDSRPFASERLST